MIERDGRGRFPGRFRGLGARLSGRAVAVTAGLGIAFGIYQGTLVAVTESVPVEVAFGVAIPATVFSAMCILFATLAAEECVARGAKPLPAYLAAVIAGSVAGALVEWRAVGELLAGLHRQGDALSSGTAILLWTIFFDCLSWGSIVVFIYVIRQRAARAAAVMQAAQLRRADAQRRSLESRLQALQARVEPQFLLQSVAQVRELYDADPQRGSQMLGDLITYLRAALPQVREAASTVRREVDLVRAYLEVMRACPDNRFTCRATVAGETAAARMPAMVLPPLVNMVLGDVPASIAEEGTLAITAGPAAGRLRVEIVHVSAAPTSGEQTFERREPEETVGRRELEQRLRALYDDDWTLAFERSHGRDVRAVLEVPWARVEPADPAGLSPSAGGAS